MYNYFSGHNTRGVHRLRANRVESSDDSRRIVPIEWNRRQFHTYCLRVPRVDFQLRRFDFGGDDSGRILKYSRRIDSNWVYWACMIIHIEKKL